MTLHVPFEQFAETAKRVLGETEAYLEALPKGTRATAAHKSDTRIVCAWTSTTLAEAKAALEKAGMRAHSGTWSLDASVAGDGLGREMHVATVAYSSGEEAPGIWVDAYEDPPTQLQVLRTLYDEFRETGEVGDVSFDAFVRMAQPNVLILSLAELREFLRSKAAG